MLTYEALVCQSWLVQTRATFYLHDKWLSILNKSQGIQELADTNMRVIFVLGGSGSVGVLNMANSSTFLCAHLSVGDALRVEAAEPDSPYTRIM